MQKEPSTQKVLKVSAGVIVNLDGRVLLCQRGYGPQKGQWEFPGGKQEIGESAQQCLEREIHEELALHVICTRELLRMRYEYTDKTIDFCFLLAQAQQEQMEVREHQKVVWLDWEEIRNYDLCPADAKAYACMLQSGVKI